MAVDLDLMLSLVSTLIILSMANLIYAIMDRVKIKKNLSPLDIAIILVFVFIIVYFINYIFFDFFGI